MNCALTCPAGVQFEFAPAATYACDYAVGTFRPANIPKCVYGEGVQVIQRFAEEGEEDSMEGRNLA
jgi:hypothetical protein